MRVWAAICFAGVALCLGTGCVAVPAGQVYHDGVTVDAAGPNGAACADCAAGTGEAWQQYTIGNRLHRMMTCGAGCSELYWGEWSYDPPPAKGCDKCDMDGHWIGPQPCGEDRCHHGGLRGLWGQRFCSVCEGPCTGVHGDAPVVSGDVPVLEPRPANGAAVPTP